MRAYSFLLQKGGVGRTSTSGSVARLIADAGYRTVLVDCDVQGNQTQWQLGEHEMRWELADVLQGRTTVGEALEPVTENMSILGTVNGSTELAAFKENGLSRRPFIFQDVNAQLAELGVDFVVYDGAPGLNQMERSVALASDEVIAVMLPETFSVLGFQIFTRFLDEVNQAYRADTYNRIVVVNRVNLGINAHKGNVAEAQERLTTREVFTVPQDVNIEKAQDGGVMLWDINRYSRAIEAYREIAGRLINA